MGETTEEKLIKIETELPYIKKELGEIWTALTPITRDTEESKQDMIRYGNKLENFERELKELKDVSFKELKDLVKKQGDTLAGYDEGFKFLANARKNINTIFVAIAIQTIFLIGGLLAFVFVLTQKNTPAAQQAAPGVVTQQQPQNGGNGGIPQNSSPYYPQQLALPPSNSKDNNSGIQHPQRTYN